VTEVALVAMPIASPHHPNLALSLLKAGLRQKKIKGHIRNFYLDFVKFVGMGSYEIISDDSLYKALLGEWLFAGCLRESTVDQELKYFTNVLLKEYPKRFSMDRLNELMAARRKAAKFVDYCVSAEDWEKYRVVGFASSFQQQFASLSLAKRLKVVHPHLLIVFGGANCEGEMGAEMLRVFPFIDAVFSGESDETFPDFVESYLEEPDPDNAISQSEKRRWPTPISALRQVDLDQLPAPDFSDFFEQREEFPTVKERYQAVPLFESARGCWWGAKHHCTFCGLNGSSMSYRSKSQARAFSEIDQIASAYGREILVVDNILDLKYFNEFIPALSAREPRLLLHYETKVNLSVERLKKMAEAGIRKIQPGIESLSSSILKLMDKGCTLLQNVRTLKFAAECGIYVEWGFLYGFPGETPDHYRDMSAVIPRLRHLQPPAGVTKVRADRFSPYFNSPRKYGVRIRPFTAYEHIYTDSDANIDRLAYHFDLESDDILKVDEYTAAAVDEIQYWYANRRKFRFYFVDDGNRIIVHDSRTDGEVHHLELRDLKAKILRACLDITSMKALADSVCEEVRLVEMASAEMCRGGILLREDDSLLALPLRQPGYERALDNVEIREPLERCYWWFRGDAGSAAAR
jgi:ribosomal peptide maturation radical SAM protein 1